VRTISLDDIDGSVGRTSVDNNVFKVRVVLGENGTNALFQKSRLIETHADQADLRELFRPAPAVAGRFWPRGDDAPLRPGSNNDGGQAVVESRKRSEFIPCRTRVHQYDGSDLRQVRVGGGGEPCKERVVVRPSQYIG